MRIDDWFLTNEERGNSHTVIDSRRSSDVAWTEGNRVELLVDGEAYFASLVRAISDLRRGDQLLFTDWRSDGDESLAEEGPTIATLLVDACQRGVDVRGLLWRSHSDRFAFSAKENRHFAVELTKAGGEVLLDERVRRGGSHHQKMVLVRSSQFSNLDVAFVGGIDLSHGRRDNAGHQGNAQPIKLDHRYGPHPAWHDAQLEIRGPAIGDLDLTFRERWQDPTPLNHAGRVSGWAYRTLSRDRIASKMSDGLGDPPALGGHAVQVLRTYPSRRPKYPFAPNGERSVARAFVKAIARARCLIYIVDQYFWSRHIATILASALRLHPELQLIVVVPRFPDKDGPFSGPPSRLAQAGAMAIVRSAGGDRVRFYDVQNDKGLPIYVHAKVCVIDDVWATVGSDNLNRRSCTHDSELSCAVIDDELDGRQPLDPGGLGDGSRRFARNLRLTLWAEHLGRSPDDAELLDIANSGRIWEQAAGDLERWEAGVARGSRPSSRIRTHVIEPVPRGRQRWAKLAYRLIFDPDGRPLMLRIRNRY